jgi:ATP-dependent DNA ligase
MIEYIGPKKLIRPSALHLFENKNYVLQHKNDGCWCEVRIDGSGNVVLFARSGNVHSLNLTKEITKVKLPQLKNSVLLGELEIKTEWSTKRSRERGYPVINLFDVKRLQGEDFFTVQWNDRNSIVNECHKAISNKFFSVTESVYANFVFAYSNWRKRGIEGGVLKLRTSSLIERDREGKLSSWIKVLDFPRT